MIANYKVKPNAQARTLGVGQQNAMAVSNGSLSSGTEPARRKRTAPGRQLFRLVTKPEETGDTAAAAPQATSKRKRPKTRAASTGEEYDPVKDVPDLMQSLQQRDREDGGGGIYVPKVFRRIVGNGDQAIVLAQIYYWFCRDKKGKRQRARCYIDGRPWLAKQHKQLADEVGMNERVVKNCIDNLVKKKLVIKCFKFFDGKKTTHLRPDVERLAKKMTNAFREWI